MKTLNSYMEAFNKAKKAKDTQELIGLFLRGEKIFIEEEAYGDLAQINIHFIDYWYHLNDYEKVIVYATRYLRFIENHNLISDQSLYYSISGMLNFLLEDYKSAIRNIQSELKIHIKANDRANILGCHTNIGILEIELGNFEKALEELMYAENIIGYTNIDKSPEAEISNKINIACVLIKLGRYEEGLAYLKEAEAHPLTPGIPMYNIEILMYYGLYYEGQSNQEVALNYYERAKVMAEDNDFIHERKKIYDLLGKILYGMKRYKESCDYLQQYTELIASAARQVQKSILAKVEVELHLGEKVKEVENLKAITDKIQKESDLDYLTGTYSRRYITNYLKEVFKKYQDKENEFSVFLFDIDDFKKVNDSYGHLIGDQVITELGQVMTSVLDQDQVLGRIGGDEFVILLDGQKKEEAIHQVESFLKVIRNHVIYVGEAKKPVKITISGGLTDNQDKTIKDMNTMLYIADQALYKAKEFGKNRVIIG